MKRAFIVLLAMATALAAQSPTIVNMGGRPVLPTGTSPFGGPFEFKWQALPTSLTDVATATAHITGYCFYNSNVAARTLTIQTKDGSPLPLPLSGSLAAATTVCFTFDQGLLVNGGFSVQASATGVYYYAKFTN